MAKRRRTALARRSSRRIKSHRGSSGTRGILPAAGALGVVGILVANDWANSGNSPLGFLMAGNFNSAFYSLSKNITQPALIAGMVPAVIVVWLLLMLHKKFRGAGRISKKWSLI